MNTVHTSIAPPAVATRRGLGRPRNHKLHLVHGAATILAGWGREAFVLVKGD